jgi:UDP-GlcNAc:undecaprenyl-phosphate/decaprenyl-phosphate GlcNAc-1-phosphate transferase
MAIVALPAAAAVIWAALRSPLSRRLVAVPSDDRWHDRPTPMVGGIGIVAGIYTAAAAAIAVGALDPSWPLFGVLAGVLILFVAGLADDLFSLGPAVKLATQVAAAVVVMASGLSVEIIENNVLAIALGLVWYVGMTNAFNLLDNIDGLAATLAAIAAAYFALDALLVNPNTTVLVLSLAVFGACAGFLPFNLGRGGRASAFLGDSGSQVLGFSLAALGLASTWSVAGATFATVLVPIVVLGIPIVDTGLVTVMRLRDGRPIYRGGRDHTSHRLVYRGLSERRAVAVLAAIAALLGATSLAYGLVQMTELTVLGVLLTFALLVQFVSYLAEVERTPGGAAAIAERPLVRRIVVSPKRLLEVVLDFALIFAAFLAAFLIETGGGSPGQRGVFLYTLPALLVSRYVAFIVFSLYRRVWRYAGARDGVAIVAAVGLSEIGAMAPVIGMRAFWDFPMEIFVLNALLCTAFIGASRFGERALGGILASLREGADVRRTLIVGAGRTGRSLLRELRETPGEHVVGFIDDDGSLHGRRLQGTPVLGGTGAAERLLEALEPDAVLITIPDAPLDRLDDVVEACLEAEIPCHFVRRQLAPPDTTLGVAAR